MSAILDFRDYSKTQRFRADVVVVGTGAGGASVGATLAEAGLDVLFVEEGSYHPTSSFNPHLTESIPRLYRDAGSTVLLGSPSIPFLEGRCVGGSTVLNGGMTWRTPDHVLTSWERETGDATLGPAGMEPWFERVEGAVHAKPQLAESRGDDSRIMAQGAEKLGWRYEENHRNQESCVGANNCVFGCPTGAKQSTLVSWMPRAMNADARCLTEVRVERLIIEGGRCVGVAGHAVDPRTRKRAAAIEVRGDAVVIACGAVQTPYLLLRHRLARRSRQLGRNLLVHPNIKVTAVYPFDVKGWQGVSQAGQIREFHDDGIVLAENFVPPGAMAGHLPNHGREAWELMQRYDQMVLSGALVEDSTSGRVRRGPFGLTVAQYQINDTDYRRFKRGALLLSELHFAMGAEMVVLPFATDHYARSMDEARAIIERQRKMKDLELFTVHLMGTARMGATPESSVVDLDGRIWDLPGCYVADASVFPTAIGVNPQITIMALACRIGERLAEQQLSRKARAAA